ncbi:MAG: ABC transporter permease [Phycisphaerales bacterium]
MITLGRFFRSRASRKFRKDRMAVVSMAVIGLYVLIGLAGFVGLISIGDALERAGPDSTTGFFQDQTPEKRLRDARFWREIAERALRRENPQAAIREAAFFERALAPLPPAEVTTLVREADGLYNAVADHFDEATEARLMIEELQKQPTPDPAAIAEQAAAREKAQAAAAAALTELERVTLRLFPIPDGWRGTLYHFRTFLGTDRQGRSISMRGLYSVRIALQVGLVVGLVSLTIGALLGAAAAFFGGWVDHAVTWLYSTFSSIPELVLLSLIAYVFQGWNFVDELIPVYAALSLTFWIGPCRVIRGEVMKIRELEYVQAATAIGFRRWYIMLRHVLPNTAHLMLITFSLLFIAAVKAEVILTFLGLGVKNGASWGIMIGQSRQEVINGFLWQIGVATVLMFFLVLAFNILTDALQDAFDPKHVGK